jgi:hypothetical protein
VLVGVGDVLDGAVVAAGAVVPREVVVVGGGTVVAPVLAAAGGGFAVVVATVPVTAGRVGAAGCEDDLFLVPARLASASAAASNASNVSLIQSTP